jgi:hypothetical protein
MQPVETWYQAITSGRPHERRPRPARQPALAGLRRHIGRGLISLGRAIAADRPSPAAFSSGR